jgi:hypothetical protein
LFFLVKDSEQHLVVSKIFFKENQRGRTDYRFSKFKRILTVKTFYYSQLKKFTFVFSLAFSINYF